MFVTLSVTNILDRSPTDFVSNIDFAMKYMGTYLWKMVPKNTVKWFLYMSDDVCRSSLSVSFYDYKKYKS